MKILFKTLGAIIFVALLAVIAYFAIPGAKTAIDNFFNPGTNIEQEEPKEETPTDGEDNGSEEPGTNTGDNTNDGSGENVDNPTTGDDTNGTGGEGENTGDDTTGTGGEGENTGDNGDNGDVDDPAGDDDFGDFDQSWDDGSGDL